MKSVRDRENEWNNMLNFLKKGKCMKKVYDICNRDENNWKKSLSLSNKHKKGSKFQSAKFILIDPSKTEISQINDTFLWKLMTSPFQEPSLKLCKLQHHSLLNIKNEM